VGELRGQTRLLTIVGPSGVGKTRLARRVMDELEGGEPRFESIEFCNLVGAANRSDAQAAIVRVLGPPRDVAPQLAKVKGLARGRRLLVLDNVDVLVREVAPLVEELLLHQEGLQILVTSVVPLGLRQEVCFELGSLDVDDAVELYLDRIHRLRANRDGVAEDRASIVELVARLDRIPLAIELAAARSTVLPPRVLLSQMDQRFELLRSGRPGRHSSLYQALTLTWELLTDLEREALARASVFVGGFSLEAAEAILGGKGVNVVSLLDGLRSKAFLQLDESAEQPRFWPYESVRAYSALRLGEAGVNEEESRRRHQEFFLREGEHHAARAVGAHGLRSIHWLVAESENILAAHRWASASDPAVAGRLGLVLAPVLEFLGPHPSEMEILESTRLALVKARDPRLLLRLAWFRGHALLRHGMTVEAARETEESLALARRLKSRSSEGYLLMNQALLRVFDGENDEALAQMNAVLAIAREIGDRDLEGRAFMGMGMLEEHRSRFDAAMAHLGEALRVYRLEGNLKMEASVHFTIGATWSHRLQFGRARQATEQARAIFRKIGDRAGEGYVLVNLGAIYLNAGQLEEAERSTTAGLRLDGAKGRRRFESQALFNLGLIALERGDTRLAEQQLLEAIALYEEFGDRRHRARCLCFVAAAEANLGRTEEARRSLDEARAFFEQLGDEVVLGAFDVFEGILEAAEARKLATHSAYTRKAALLRERAMARQELAASGGLPSSSMLALGLRILEKGLASATYEAERAQPESFTVGPEGRWFQPEGGDRVDLRRRHALRGVLLGLVRHRLESPGSGLSLGELFELGWAGEMIQASSASKRVYTAIWSLRSLGLSTALVHQGEGYMIDPSVSVILSEAR